MALPKWLDRIWLCLIALSFCIIVPLYTILWAQRVGWLNLIVYVALMFSGGFLTQLVRLDKRGKT